MPSEDQTKETNQQCFEECMEGGIEMLDTKQLCFKELLKYTQTVLLKVTSNFRELP